MICIGAISYPSYFLFWLSHWSYIWVTLFTHSETYAVSRSLRIIVVLIKLVFGEDRPTNLKSRLKRVSVLIDPKANWLIILSTVDAHVACKRERHVIGETRDM